jgi:hypothetical protein
VAHGRKMSAVTGWSRENGGGRGGVEEMEELYIMFING